MWKEMVESKFYVNSIAVSRAWIHKIVLEILTAAHVSCRECININQRTANEVAVGIWLETLYYYCNYDIYKCFYSRAKRDYNCRMSTFICKGWDSFMGGMR